MVKSGMGLNKLELDFRKFHTNVINLIVGNNGTGKTGGVLSNLHPFAGLGHLEARDDSDIIIPGKNGHKVIIFTNQNHEYYIEHHYAFQGKKRSRKISSYCKKDGKELNPSGSVTSFNLLIESEFQIDLNFLKLMRLGPNVKNFITLGATERKTFIAKLLEEVESYIKDQKSASERSTLLSNALKIAIDKKKRLNIEDITTVEDIITEKQKRLKYLQECKENRIKEFFAYKGSMNTKRFETFDEDYSSAEHEIFNLSRELKKLQKPKYQHIDIGVSPISLYNDRISEYQEEKMHLVSKLASMNTKTDSLQEKYTDLDQEVSEAKSTMEEEELNGYIEDLQKKISYYESHFKEEEVPHMTKEELTSDVDKINMILFHIDEILQLPEDTLRYYKENYSKYGNDLNRLDNFAKDKLQDVTIELESYYDKPKKHKMRYALFLPDSCKDFDHCPYYKMVSMEQYQKKNKERKAELEIERDCLEGLSQIAGGLYAIRRILSMRKADISEYTLDENNVMECILNQDKSYLPQPKLVQSLLERIEFHDEYLENQKSLKEAKLQLQVLHKGNSRPYKELVEEQASLTIQIQNLEKEVKKIDKKLESINHKIKATEELLQDYTLEIDYNMKSSEFKRKIQEEEKKLQELESLRKERDQYKEKEDAYNRDIDSYDFQIHQETEDIYELRTKEDTFNKLNDEIENTEKYYGYTELIRDAVSSKTGIPKIHIMFYCRALKNIANKIISEIYDGELILRDFEITDTKFNIPYYTKGVNVSDIRYASQAEASVATIAISFAILLSFTPNYNIILLDEVDGPLYDTNKRKFFAAIEGELKEIGCEQVFMITQSKMYNDYPVNLIITDPEYATYTNDSHSIIFQR